MKRNPDCRRGVSVCMPCGCILLVYMGLPLIGVGGPPPILDGLARTLHAEHDIWQNTSWGFHGIARQHGSYDVAITGNGSRVNRVELTSYRLWFLPHPEGWIHSLYLQPENAGYTIDDSARTIRGGPCHCFWPLARLHLVDPGCKATIAELLPEARQTGAGRVAGQDVLRFQASGENGSITEIALAPGLGCQVLEYDTRWPGTWGIPGTGQHWVVTGYASGEPDPKLFHLPTGYHLRRTDP